MEELQTKTERSGFSRRTIGLLVALGALIVALLILVFAVPRFAQHTLDTQLERVSERTGLSIHVDDFQTKGLNEAHFQNIQVSTPDGVELVSIGSLQASVSLIDVLRGQATLSAFSIADLSLYVHRYEDGTLSLDLSRSDAPTPTPTNERSASTPDPFERLEGLLRYFGQQYPRANIENLEVLFTSDSTPWPLEALNIDEVSIAGGQTAPLDLTLAITPHNHPQLQLPDEVSIEGTLNLPIARSSLDVQFSSPLKAANIRRLPYTEASLDGLSISDDFSLTLHHPQLLSRTGTQTQPLIEADHFLVRFDTWPITPSDMDILEVDLHGLHLFVDYDQKGASNIGDLYTLIRQPAAREVRSRAQSIASSILKAQRSEEEDSEADATAPSSDPPEESSSFLANLPLRELFTTLPQQTRLRDFTLEINDARPHPLLTHRASKIVVAAEALDFRHRPIQGVLDGQLILEIRADDDTSSVDVDFEIPYRRGDWNAEINIDAIQLANLAQIGGPRVTKKIQGGLITASLEITNQREGQARTSFDGLFALRDLHVNFPSFAEDPLLVDQSSLNLRGYYDPNASIPTPQLIKTGASIPSDPQDAPQDEALPPDAEPTDAEPHADPPPDKGAIVIEEATARLGEVESTFQFQLYGIDGLRLPNRIALDVQLPRTELMDLYAAIPDAILGPFVGTRLNGSLAWTYALEIPLHEASHMRWDSDARLSDDFQVLYLPPEIDVFKIGDEFEHTIRDEWESTYFYRERKLIYERDITIPAMRPIPAPWLIENAGLELEEIDEVRRERDWPPVPVWDPFDRRHGLDQETLESKEYWLSEHALRQAPPYPFNDPEPTQPTPVDSFWDSFRTVPSFDPYNDDRVVLFEEPEHPGAREEIRLDTERYGPYVYVPLNHISPYLPRAILTTEDTAFFTHKGFSFLAIRHSVEANINAGGFVRGGSTISMQLAKNLFLDRSRVLSRKLQEVTLVWLMESVAQIPKERLLELYLNIIEFGPGVYGINDASVHYFGKRPDELTISEVAWLVSIVPSPKRHHIHYDRGEIPRWFFNRMSRYIRAMFNRERITEEEMEAAFEDHPSFYIPDDGEPVLRRYAPPEEDAAVEPTAEDPSEDAAPTRPPDPEANEILPPGPDSP